MEKILVLSDSHGNINNMIYAVRCSLPDRIIHLGDCRCDVEQLAEEFPDIPIDCVPGNCDCIEEETEKILEIEGKQFLLCHGHTYAVKMGLMHLMYSAMEQNVDIALFGHTHRVFSDYHNNVRYFNPGSIGQPGIGVPPSYGIITLDEASDDVEMKVQYIEYTI